MCLPLRESATVETWLKEHPEVTIVSRDRGKEFAKAATLGAPQARQVVDRFHLVRNLAEVLAARSLRIVARKFARKTLISFCHKRQQRTLLVRFLLQLR